MARVTNFGRKRTYLEANQDDAQMHSQLPELTSKSSADPEAKCAGPTPISAEPTSEPPKKRRKRAFSKKKSGQREASKSGMSCRVGLVFKLPQRSMTLRNN
jgi:hypothetical protein